MRATQFRVIALLLVGLSIAPFANTQLHAAKMDDLKVDSSQPSQVLDHGFIIDHDSVALFEQIPESYITGARNLRMVFSDRSVGQNINEALDCLTASSWATAPASCRNDYDTSGNAKTWSQADRDNGIVPARILFNPDPVKYNRSNWTFEYKTGSWSELTQDFVQVLAPAYINSKDVLSYQFSYLNVDANSDIANPTTGFFANNSNRYDIHDLEAYIAQHPDKTFFLWTTSLARSIGTQPSTDFNNQMRQYAAANDKILFDMADIIAHTDQGVPCYDNQNDGQNHPAICPDYTTEAQGGHLGAVSGGKIRMAKAFWVLMAVLAGWDGVGSSPSTPTPTRTPPLVTSTPIITITPTPTRTPPPVTSTPIITVTPTPTRTPTPTGDLIFADSFESGNLTRWSNFYTDGNDLSVARTATMHQSYGLQATIDDNVAISLIDERPAREPRYRARFYFDPNSIAMGPNDSHVLFAGYSDSGLTRPVVQILLYFNGAYRLQVALLNDATSWRVSAPIAVSDAPHAVEISWSAATSSGANNGSLAFWIDGTQRSNLTGVDNDTRRIERVRLGPLAGIDNQTRGSYYFDAFESRRQTWIGPAVGMQPAAMEDIVIDPAEFEFFSDEEETAPPDPAGPYDLPWDEEPGPSLENPLYLPLLNN